MKPLINKTKSALSGVVIFAFSCVLTGLGLATVSLLALFALAAMGVAILAAPFMALSQPAADEMDETVAA